MRQSKTHTKKKHFNKTTTKHHKPAKCFFLEISCIQMMAHVLMKCIFHFYQQCQCFLKSFALRDSVSQRILSEPLVLPSFLSLYQCAHHDTQSHTGRHQN